MAKKISVIIPVYNREGPIKKAINSVLAQTYPNFEIVIIDDLSTDKTVEIVNSFNDSRILFLQLKKNSGAAAARNYGIRHSSGEIISFLDSDDFFEPRFLQRSEEILGDSAPNIGFMWTGVRYHFKDKIEDSSWSPLFKTSSYVTFLTKLQIGTGAGISIKREVFEKCGYFKENLPAAEDTEFFLRISQKYDYTFIPDILINIIKGSSDRMSINYRNLGISYNKFLHKHFHEIDKHPEMQVNFYYKMMWLNYHLKNKIRARYFYSKIPLVTRSMWIKCATTKMIYEIFPLKFSSFIHQKLSR